MRVKGHLALQILDAMETVGVDRRELLAAVGLDEATVRDPRALVEWGRIAAMLELASRTLGGDPERLRLAGRALARAPSYVLVHRLARALVPLERIYDVGVRWGSPASMPHLRLRHEVVGERRLRFVGEIPEPHEPSAAMNHVFEGILVELPVIVGLPPATIVSSTVTPRSIDVVIELPPRPSRRERVGRALHSLLGGRGLIDVLEAQRRELQDALIEAQRSTAENRELLDRLPDFVMVHRDGVLLWLNQANLHALGYERTDEIVGRRLMDLVEPESRPMIAARMRTPIGANVPALSEIRLLTREGRVVVTEISPAQTVTWEGRPARLVVGRDVTERARLQQQLLVADRMASVGMLTAGVAHEVNNPLAYVLTNVELARRKLAPLGEPTREAREMLDVALEGVDRIRAIARDVLALSRVDEAVGPVDAGAVVESTLKLARRHVEDRAVLELERHPTPKIAGHVARLGQVVLNLVVNALQSMPERPREQNVLRVVVRPSEAGGARIEVTDNGVGIAPEHATRIFDPFFTTKAAGVGTGLGLPICQRVITEMGGTITFDSRVGQGTTFHVTLAAWDASAGVGGTAGGAPRVRDAASGA
jgi:PAS domain S-box-containing protein